MGRSAQSFQDSPGVEFPLGRRHVLGIELDNQLLFNGGRQFFSSRQCLDYSLKGLDVDIEPRRDPASVTVFNESSMPWIDRLFSWTSMAMPGLVRKEAMSTFRH